MTTQLWAVRSALITMFDEATGPDVKVFSGPRPRGASPRAYVLVGSDGGDTGLGEDSDDGLSAEQSDSDLGPGTWRDERGDLICSAWAWSGASSVDTTTDAAKTVFEQCIEALHADRSLGGLLNLPGLAQMTGLALREVMTKQGPVVRIAFSVSYGALITT